MSFERIVKEMTWTLFLDRDGVINKMVEGGYVLDPSQLEIIEGVPLAIELLARWFRRIFIVTNQQCIERGLITMDGVNNLHNKMLMKIDPFGKYITEIFVSPHLEGKNNQYRKPGTGMADEAKRKYSEVNLDRSVMVGDNETDMLFGKRAGMLTILIGNHEIKDKKLVDRKFGSLLKFAESLRITESNLYPNKPASLIP